MDRRLPRLPHHEREGRLVHKSAHWRQGIMTCSVYRLTQPPMISRRPIVCLEIFYSFLASSPNIISFQAASRLSTTLTRTATIQMPKSASSLSPLRTRRSPTLSFGTSTTNSDPRRARPREDLLTPRRSLARSLVANGSCRSLANYL